MTADRLEGKIFALLIIAVVGFIIFLASPKRGARRGKGKGKPLPNLNENRQSATEREREPRRNDDIGL